MTIDGELAGLLHALGDTTRRRLLERWRDTPGLTPSGLQAARHISEGAPA